MSESSDLGDFNQIREGIFAHLQSLYGEGEPGDDDSGAQGLIIWHRESYDVHLYWESPGHLSVTLERGGRLL